MGVGFCVREICLVFYVINSSLRQKITKVSPIFALAQTIGNHYYDESCLEYIMIYWSLMIFLLALFSRNFTLRTCIMFIMLFVSTIRSSFFLFYQTIWCLVSSRAWRQSDSVESSMCARMRGLKRAGRQAPTDCKRVELRTPQDLSMHTSIELFFYLLRRLV